MSIWLSYMAIVYFVLNMTKNEIGIIVATITLIITLH